jgi:hypothetical protein
MRLTKNGNLTRDKKPRGAPKVDHPVELRGLVYYEIRRSQCKQRFKTWRLPEEDELAEGLCQRCTTKASHRAAREAPRRLSSDQDVRDNPPLSFED